MWYLSFFINHGENQIFTQRRFTEFYNLALQFIIYDTILDISLSKKDYVILNPVGGGGVVALRWRMETKGGFEKQNQSWRHFVD